MTIVVVFASACGNQERTARPSTQAAHPKDPQVTQLATRLTNYLEREEADEEEPAIPFCAVLVLGIGKADTFGGIRATPIYTAARCDQYEPSGDGLYSISGWGATPTRFLVSDIDDRRAMKVRVWEQPLDGADNDSSLRRLFPPDMLVALHRKPSGSLSNGDALGCENLERARLHFALPNAPAPDGYDPCDPPSHGD